MNRVPTPAGPYRTGPWPGLTLRGAAVLLGCALLLALALSVTGSPRRAWPDLVWLAVTALLPLLIATNVIQTPGATSAVCGAYLLPRSLISLVQPEVELPPLLLVPAITFDLVWWLRQRPRLGKRKRVRKRPPPGPLTRRRAALAGLLFGLVLCAVEPPFVIVQGRAWSGDAVWPAAILTGLGCAALATVSARDTAW